MNKKQLIEAIEQFPDDVEVCVAGGFYIESGINVGSLLPAGPDNRLQARVFSVASYVAGRPYISLEL